MPGVHIFIVPFSFGGIVGVMEEAAPAAVEA